MFLACSIPLNDTFILIDVTSFLASLPCLCSFSIFKYCTKHSTTNTIIYSNLLLYYKLFHGNGLSLITWIVPATKILCISVTRHNLHFQTNTYCIIHATTNLGIYFKISFTHAKSPILNASCICN